MLTLAFGATDAPIVGYSESGAPGAQAVSDAVEFRQRVVDSQQPDGVQLAPTRPSVKVGRSAGKGHSVVRLFSGKELLSG